MASIYHQLGVSQGDPLSAIIFKTAKNTLVDSITQCSQLGYSLNPVGSSSCYSTPPTPLSSVMAPHRASTCGELLSPGLVGDVSQFPEMRVLLSKLSSGKGIQPQSQTQQQAHLLPWGDQFGS